MPLQVADVLEFESTPSKSIRAKIEIFDSPRGMILYPRWQTATCNSFI
jgi:hypothetical protein